MNLPYTGNIPDPPHNPSTDVPDMQTNTNSIQTWTTLDHYGFTDNKGGWHQFVHLFNTSAPSLSSGSATADGVLYSSSGNPFWANAAIPAGFPLAFVTASSIIQNGYIKISGLIIQWGVVSAPSGTGGPFNFPTPFPNNFFSMSLTMDRSSGSSTNYDIFLSGTPSKTQFSTNSGTSGAHNVYFIAIGN